MNWATIQLIFTREVRDQLRDRRTLLIVIGVPMLLYPALGIVATEFTVRNKESARHRVGLVGRENLPARPRLLDADGCAFAPELLASTSQRRSLEILPDQHWTAADVREGRIEAMISIPTDARERLDGKESVRFDVTRNSTSERSEACYFNAVAALEAWKRLLVNERLTRLGLNADFVDPVQIGDPATADVATVDQHAGAVWGRLIPFVLVMTAMTGAFYPAVDLCAGEKERGTMETLLISPASRGEIVLAKFFTIWLFSVVTTTFNLLSLGLTFQLAAPTLVGQGGTLVAPPPLALLGTLMLMAPLAALFSAWCLALSAFARSTKEGQYYLMPLFLIVMPLVFVTLTPGIELTVVTSLTPVTNVSLLVRTLLVGEYQRAMLYAPLVLAPTILYGYLALRWAVDQFHREEVLFREAERLEPPVWLRRRLGAKEPTPDVGEAVFGFLLTLGLACLAPVQGFGRGLWAAAFGQTALIALPPVLWAFFLTSSPRRTLLLRWPNPRDLLLAGGLGLLLHPAASALDGAMRQIYPQNGSPAALFEPSLTRMDDPTQIFLVLAVLRAVCDEAAFRGFLLVGLLRRYPAALAILISGVLGGVFRLSPAQMPAAMLLGVVSGVLATRTGSLLPSVTLSAVHYGLLLPGVYPHLFGRGPDAWLATAADLPLVAASALGAAWATAMVARRPVAANVP